GNGAVALLERGAENIAPFREEPPYGVDVAGLQRWAQALAGEARERVRVVPEVPRLAR
ncbi:DUF309 domain-containing protein, partial [Amycolatopsis sp. NPDC000740]